MNEFDQRMFAAQARLREAVDGVYARHDAMIERDRRNAEIEAARPMGVDVTKIIPRGPLPPQGHRTYKG